MNAMMNLGHNSQGNTLGELNELVSRRQKWENGAEKSANELLYAILQDCLAMYECYQSSKQQGLWKNSLQEVANKQEIKLLKGKVLRNIVRVVFGANQSNRKRTSYYAKALEAAFAAKVPSQKLDSWIKEQGGILETARRKPLATDVIRRHEFVQSNLKPKVVVTKSEVANMIGSDDMEELVVLLARRKADGSLEFYDSTSKATPVRAVLQSLYCDYKQRLEEEIDAARIMQIGELIKNKKLQASAAKGVCYE